MLETGSNQVAVVSQILSKYEKKKSNLTFGWGMSNVSSARLTGFMKRQDKHRCIQSSRGSLWYPHKASPFL